MQYSDDEKKVLGYFFTNLDKPVFAAKNFHPEVWALMQARYSRSKEGMRESLLQLLKEDPENFNKLLEEIDAIRGGIQSQHATEKAIQFMEKWVLGYGHTSVAEGAVIGLGVEGVSIIATKFIEDNRLSSFIEKSTRYVSFDNSSFYLDEKIRSSKFYPDVKELLELLLRTYHELHEPVLEYVKKVAPLERGVTEAAWERACAARRFDAIRYLLPACIKTSFGWTVNARELSYAISKMLSSDLKEMNEIGVMVKEEASKVLPSLLRFADKKEYLLKTQESMTYLTENLDLHDDLTEPVTIVNNPREADDHILSAIIYRWKNAPYETIKRHVKSLSPKEKEELFDAYLKNMGPYDSPMRELEHVQFTFEITMDYGAFRDLQRHRICTQTTQLLTTDLGYEVPQDVVNAGCEPHYRKAMDKAKFVFDKLRKDCLKESQYIVPLGYRKRYLLTMNLREVYHFVKLRTIPLAHESYRKVAYQLYEVMREKYPLLTKYIVCNYNKEELGRLKTEEMTEKLDKVTPL